MPDLVASPGKPTRFKEQLFRRLRWEDIDTEYLQQLIDLARAEDMEGAGLRELPRNPGDATTQIIDEDVYGTALLVARREMTVCGIHLVPMVLAAFKNGEAPTFKPAVNDGAQVIAGAVLGEIKGPATTILTAERIILNFLQKLSGIATQTARYVSALGWSQTRLLDTRKTSPGYRVLEKYAVACGGGWNHRMGLFDRVMIKDNHLAASDAADGVRLAGAVSRARKRNPNLAIEVEVDSLTQIEPVLTAGPDIILLDNFTPEELAEAVDLIGEKAWTEASGGISLRTLPELGNLGLDFISSGALVHQAVWVDIGVDWVV